MRRIEVLGPGCKRCQDTFNVVKAVLEEERLEAELAKIDSIQRIAELGIAATPGIAIDGKVVSSGRVPRPDEVRQLLKA